jgi:hypothetical protein
LDNRKWRERHSGVVTPWRKCSDGRTRYRPRKPRFSTIDVHQPLPLFLHFRLPGGKKYFRMNLKVKLFAKSGKVARKNKTFGEQKRHVQTIERKKLSFV